MSAMKAVIDCVHGAPLQTYPGSEMSAAKRLVDQHGITPQRASKIMAFCTAHRIWGGVVVTVEKLELHLAKILAEMSKDPNADGDLPGWQAHQTYEDPAGDAPRELAEKTNAEKIAAAQQPWRDLIDEAHARGLTGLAMSRWVFAERERRTGKPGIAVAANKMLDAIVSKAGRPDFGELLGAPKTEPEDDDTVRNPRHFAEEGEGE